MLAILKDALTIFTILFTFFYIIVPILFVAAPKLMQRPFFLNFVRNPFANFTDLSANGINSRGRNFFLKDGKILSFAEAEAEAQDAKQNPVIGVWHILPASIEKELLLQNKELNDVEVEATLSTGSEPIFIYLHGNSFDRAIKYRCEFYNVLSELNYHVIAFDYRGFGNSKGYPTEEGITLDSHSVFKYVKSVASTSKPVYVWGHSMGTGVAVRLAVELCDKTSGPPPTGVVLESAFNNLPDVIHNHPFSLPIKFLPFFDTLIISPLIRSGLVMNSDERIGRIKCPILILHAADDHVIPVTLGRKLAETARKQKCRVTYVEFAEKRQFKHRYIYRAEELSKLMESFVSECGNAEF